MKPHLSRLGLGALAGALLTAPLIQEEPLCLCVFRPTARRPIPA